MIAQQGGGLNGLGDVATTCRLVSSVYDVPCSCGANVCMIVSTEAQVHGLVYQRASTPQWLDVVIME